jgi:hypothetical protein
MVLSIARQDIYFFFIDMLPLTGKRREAVDVFLLIWFP